MKKTRERERERERDNQIKSHRNLCTNIKETKDHLREPIEQKII